MASLKRAGKVICIGRNYACVEPFCCISPACALSGFICPACATQLSVHWLTCTRDHITELNSARPKQPFFFLKPPSSILLPGEGPVIRPKGVDLHY
jgi:2-keto-4-pentenoate hydratase/2-oxohepta-3-ene-1,7-dioic acid hydratase in catechol pathway